MEKIIVTINKETGLPYVKAEGFPGVDCLEATLPITEALGSVKSTVPTAEMSHAPKPKQALKQ